MSSAPRLGLSATHRAAASAIPSSSIQPSAPSRKARRKAVISPDSLAIAKPHSPRSSRPSVRHSETNRSSIPRRFRWSRASGVTTVPGTIRTSRVAPGSPSACRRAKSRSAKTSPPAGPTCPRPFRPGDRAEFREDRPDGGLDIFEGSGWSSVGQPHHAPAAGRGPAELLLQDLAVVRHRTASPRPAPSRSNARTGSPSGRPSTPSSWTTSSRSPWNVGCLTVAVAVRSRGRAAWREAPPFASRRSDSQTNRIPPTIAVRRWRQNVSGVVTPSPVGVAIENSE